MISATKFARTFTSFWQGCLFPHDYDFVKDANRRSRVFCEPLAGQADRDRYGDVSEIALRLFAASSADKGLFKNKRRTAAKIREICGPDLVDVGQFGGGGPAGVVIVGKTVAADALKIAERLQLFVERYHSGKPLVFLPIFPGCGFIDQAEGDILLGDVLYDVKSSDDTFRLNQFRQLLVYLTLNESSRSHQIRRVGLVNPRRGDFFDLHVEDFARAISGKHATELFAEVTAFISGGGISR